MSEDQAPVLNPAINDDPWRDENVNLDTRSGPAHLANLAELANEQEQETPEPNAALPEELEPESEIIPVSPPPEAVPEPVVFNYEDGSQAIVEKTGKGWKATLDSGTGAQPEVFYGATKEKMYERLMSAKIQATKKIRQQNQTIKLGPNTSYEQPAQEQTPRREFSTDEKNQMKLQVADDPSQAFDNYIQKKTGRSLEELNRDAEAGRRARQELEAEATSTQFVENTPDYYRTPENYQSVVKWISRYKLNKICNDQNFLPIIYEIYDRNLWTTRGITEAFEDLRDNGLLQLAPLTPAPAIADEEGEELEPELEIPTPTPTPVRRPRPAAGLGIRQTEARGGAKTVAPELPVTHDNLDKLTDKEIEELFAQVRQQPREAIKASLEKSRSRH